MAIQACLFDVFGTLVDWRSSVSRQLAELASEMQLTDVDWVAFTMAWRGMYQPALEEVRAGRRSWTLLDVLHRESLVVLLDRFSVSGLSDDQIDRMNRVWHRLEPWPDVVEGLTRLKRSCIIAPCSNGNVAMMVHIARHAGLTWDCVLGAEPARAYKPQREAYLMSCRMLDLAPNDVMMVAAHNSDLRAAKAVGLATCFIPRPIEHGPEQTTDLTVDPSIDVRVSSLLEVAPAIEAIGWSGLQAVY